MRFMRRSRPTFAGEFRPNMQAVEPNAHWDSRWDIGSLALQMILQPCYPSLLYLLLEVCTTHFHSSNIIHLPRPLSIANNRLIYISKQPLYDFPFRHTSRCPPLPDLSVFLVV